MKGLTDLNQLIASMQPVLQDGVYVFITLTPGQEPPSALYPRMMFREEEGITLICLKDEAETHNLDYQFPCRMITLNVHSALEAVGFIARIASHLAAAGMGVNPVSGYFHDHLFIPEDRAKDALVLLGELALASKQEMEG